MIKAILNFIKNKVSCAPIFGAQGLALSKFSPILLESANMELTDSGVATGSLLGQLIDAFVEIINSWIYIIAKYIMMFIDFCQVITYKIAGIDNDLEKMVDLPIFKFLLNETVLKAIGSILILSLVLLIIVTIVAIVKSEFEAAIDDKKDKKSLAYKAIGKSFVSLFLMVITPFIIVVAIIFSSVMLTSINNVLNSNEHQSATLGGQLFATSAYHANKYRIYANDGKRIPIVFSNFEDPYENGTYVYYTAEELRDIYEGWNGEQIYDDFANKKFQNFNDTLVYRNGKIYNATNYSEYESFIATSEQYNVMADFIDYAIANEITYYIKDSNDQQIDWNRSSSDIKISDGVYDPINKTITITYADVSNLAPYENHYTITFDTSSASANSPITDAVSTISLILGLNTIVSGGTAKNISVASNNQTLTGPINLTNTSLSGSAGKVDELIQQLSETSTNSGVTFKLLEHVKGSTNVVRWMTEKAIYNGQEYTVYELNKIFKNTITGINETRATVKVAKKDDSLNSKYYVVSEEPNDLGYYDYTNIEIDYYNDGGLYLDTLTPLFKRATWPEKLYNDLKVIYRDIDFETFLAYDNWSDALGIYFKTNTNVSSSDVSSFATTLIHPLGLIMSELFLGTTLEGGNGSTSSFSFASSYFDDITNALTMTIGGQFNAEQIKFQIDKFIELFNAQFASVIESLKKIEGFDVYGNDPLAVQGYVYKAYLASIMLADDYGDYLNEIASTLLTSEMLLEVMSMKSNSTILDKDGNAVYEIKYITDSRGEKQALFYDQANELGKAVYNSSGKKMYASNRDGELTKNGFFIPKSNVHYKIEQETVLGKPVYTYSVYVESLGAYVSASELALKDQNVYDGKDDTWTNGNYGFVLDSESGLYKLEKIDTSVDNRNNFFAGEKFEKYFEPYFIIAGDNVAIYVYEPVDDDTSKGSTIVQQELYSTTDIETVANELKNQLYSEFEIGDVVGALVSNVMDDYYLYETEFVLKTDYTYLKFKELPEIYQNFMKKMVETIENDANAGHYSLPMYYEFLMDYIENSEDMEDVMGAILIDSKTASKYYSERKSIERDIEEYTEYLKTSIDYGQKFYYEWLLESAKQKLYQMKKFYIVYGIQSYVSTQVSSGFNVVVNSHPYNVSQGMVQRELLEVIYGNRLTFSSLIGKIDNNTPFDRLGRFDQIAFDQISAYIENYAGIAYTISSGDLSTARLFSGELTDIELEIISKLYTVKTGTWTSFTNKNLARLTKEQKEKIQRELSYIASDAKLLSVNYKSGSPLNIGLSNSMELDDAYKLLKELIALAVEDEELVFVDEDYEGLISDDMEAFSLLKGFLKDFGDLCFDISRKSTLGSIGQDETENILDYIDDFISVLSERIKNLDLGAEPDYIEKLTGINDLRQYNGDFVNTDTYFVMLDKTSKEYIYTIYEVYAQKIAEYEAQKELAQNARDYATRYISGRYAMQSDSFIFATGLKEYLNYFRYNVDINNLDKDDPGYFGKYVYDEYIGGIESKDERLHYYNLYLDAFTNVQLGTNGLYFDSLTPIQQKVIQNMAEYFSDQYELFLTLENEEYSQNLYNYTLLNNYIFNNTKFGDGLSPSLVAGVAKSINISQIFNENINLLNLINVLNYVGLDYSIDKSLSDYRLDALNSLITFTERAGESGASIQARYLTLLYLICADYSQNAIGETTIMIDASTKNTVLKLAGLAGRPEEQLVGLDYEVLNTDAISDEKYGSVYIICTYNTESQMYEPFVFATGANSHGIPHTDFYESEDGSVKFFPVIAKGVIGPDGLPTAIREVNGYVEFYRETATIVDAGNLGLDMYYMSLEDISINYNPINIVANLVSTVFTGKSLAQHMVDAFPVIISSKNMNFAYGTKTNYVYHLQNGQCTLNYMFYSDTGMHMNCLYDVGELNSLIMVFGTLILAFGLISAMFGVIRNIYEIVILVIIYPGVLAMYPLKDDLQGKWRKEFIDKMLIMFGYIIAINGFFLILNLLQTMDIELVLTPESQAELKKTWLFGKFQLENVLNMLMTFAMFLVAVTLLKTLPSMFSKMLGAGDVVKRGESARNIAKVNLQETTYFTSGYAVEDMVFSKMEAMKKLPLVGSEARAIKQEKAQIKANKRAIKAYKDRLDRNPSLSDPVKNKAVKAYEDSLNRQLEVKRQRRHADEEARKVRIAKRKQRIEAAEKAIQTEHYPDKKKKPKVCPVCRTVCGGKSKACPHCGHKFK